MGSMLSGPRCGAADAPDNFRFFDSEAPAPGEPGRRAPRAQTPFDVVQSPMAHVGRGAEHAAVGPWTSSASTLAWWPYSSRLGFSVACSPPSDSAYFHMRTVRSRPADAICVDERNFGGLCARRVAPLEDLAMDLPEGSQICSSPSNDADTMRSWFGASLSPDQRPAREVAESTSTALIQSSCSKLGLGDGRDPSCARTGWSASPRR